MWAAGTLGTRISAAIRACIAGHAAPMNAMQRRGLAAASPAAGASTSGRTVVAAPVQRPCQPAGTRRATAAWADNAAAAIRVNSACVRRLLHLRPAAVAAKDDAATEEAADGVVGAEYDLSPDVFEEGAPPLPKVSRGSRCCGKPEYADSAATAEQQQSLRPAVMQKQSEGSDACRHGAQRC